MSDEVKPFRTIDSSNPEVLIKVAKAHLPAGAATWYSADHIIFDLISAFDALKAENERLRKIERDESRKMLFRDQSRLVRENFDCRVMIGELRAEKDGLHVNFAEVLKERDTLKAENEKLKDILHRASGKVVPGEADTADALLLLFQEMKDKNEEIMETLEEVHKTNKILEAENERQRAYIDLLSKGWPASDILRLEKERDALKAENEKLNNRRWELLDSANLWAARCREAEKERDQLRAVCEKLARALKFYADKNSYTHDGAHPANYHYTKILADHEPLKSMRGLVFAGKRAREALTEYEKWKNE